MIDLQFAAPDAETFGLDLDDFTTTNGWPSLLVDGAIPDCAITGTTRIDTIQGHIFVKVGEEEVDDGDGGTYMAPIMQDRGWHIDVKLSPAVPGSEAYIGVAAAISQWFAPKGEVDYDIPADVKAAYNPPRIKVKKTARGCQSLPPPTYPKRGWA